MTDPSFCVPDSQSTLLEKEAPSLTTRDLRLSLVQFPCVVPRKTARGEPKPVI